jgi:hypothetical protein
MSLLNMEVTVGRKKCVSFKKLNQTDTRQLCALLPSKRSLSPSSGRLKSLNHFPSQVGYPSIHPLGLEAAAGRGPQART